MKRLTSLAVLVILIGAVPVFALDENRDNRSANYERDRHTVIDDVSAHFVSRDPAARPAHSVLLTRAGATTFSGSGVKSSPGLMKRSFSKRYCLSYSWR